MSSDDKGGNSPEVPPSEFQPPSTGSKSPLLDADVAAEIRAFTENEDQAKSEFLPSSTASQSPLLDPIIAGEVQAFVNNEDQAQKRKHDDDIHGMRMSHSRFLLGLALVWIFVILAVVLLQGFGQWFTPLYDGYKYIPFKLSDTVVIAFITSTTATVLGLYGIAAYWLYGKPKQEVKVEPKAEKKPGG
ncbi:hypothetical protein FIV41_13430 [Pseudomonas marginalis]|uniref:Uncharacterized protein n=1 Tax=Pseudomonas marginalis TaxID=298 RepID=A0A9X9BSN0_PSEMA|nr:hypothetical protein [Pseudomonas marginalis]TWR59751.1 hypothetical protein FIV41_13430 [Pseudomonas marginalis]